MTAILSDEIFGNAVRAWGSALVHRRFEEAEIEFAYPTQTLFLERATSGSPE